MHLVEAVIQSTQGVYELRVQVQSWASRADVELVTRRSRLVEWAEDVKDEEERLKRLKAEE